MHLDGHSHLLALNKGCENSQCEKGGFHTDLVGSELQVEKNELTRP